MSAIAQTSTTHSARRSSEQPLSASQIDGALLKIKTVQAITGLGKTSIYARIKAGEFRPIRLGNRCTRFRASEVQAWLLAQGQDKQGGAQ